MLRTSLATLALAAGAQAQTLLEWQGSSANQRLGSTVSAVPDVDGDGVDEVLVGSPFLAFAGFQSGAVQLYSGAGGAELVIVGGVEPGDHAGWSAVGLPDVDGDGRGDFAVGAPEADTFAQAAGRVRVHSGASGAVLHEWFGAHTSDGLGLALAAAGDVNGDGTMDLLVGASRADGLRGRVEVRSGASGGMLRQHHGSAAGDRFGWSLCGLGDSDGDGRDDYAIGAVQDGNGPGYVRVFSGASGTLLVQLVGSGAFEEFGSALCGPGDVDGDGRGDLAVGATQAASAGSVRGRVDLYSGTTLLWSREGSGELGQFGFALAPGGDLDGDGVNEVLVGAIFGGGWRGLVSAHAGASGTAVRQWIGNGVSDRFGWSVAAIEDFDGDGRPDLLVGAPRQDIAAADEGTARVLSSASGCEGYTYCEAKVSAQGCLAAIDSTGSPLVSGAGDLGLRARGLPQRATGLFLLARAPGSQPLGFGTLCLVPPLERMPPASTGGSGQTCSGRLELALPPALLAARGWQAGDLLHAQAWCRDPGHPDGTATGLSDALAILLCP